MISTNIDQFIAELLKGGPCILLSPNPHLLRRLLVVLFILGYSPKVDRRVRLFDRRAGYCSIYYGSINLEDAFLSNTTQTTLSRSTLILLQLQTQNTPFPLLLKNASKGIGKNSANDQSLYERLNACERTSAYASHSPENKGSTSASASASASGSASASRVSKETSA